MLKFWYIDKPICCVNIAYKVTMNSLNALSVSLSLVLSFFNARYTAVSLRGPVLNLKARAKPEFLEY